MNGFYLNHHDHISHVAQVYWIAFGINSPTMATGSPSASQLEAPIEARPEVKVVVRPERVYEHLNFIAEYIEQYQPGGYHPVFLNDTYQNDGYRILKKLGEGAYSTVWLAKDTR